jgi:hypothetical protein
MPDSKIYFLSFQSIPLKANSGLSQAPYGLARLWVKAEAPNEARVYAESYLVEYGLQPKHLEQPPRETTSDDYRRKPVDLANFRKAEDFGIALHLEAENP